MGYGRIEGTVTIEEAGVPRRLVAVSYDPSTAGEVVGETMSGPDGTFTLDIPDMQDPVIVVALDDYGVVWQPDTDYSIGDRIRPPAPNDEGYVYVCLVAGNSGAVEPSWWIADGGDDTGAVGTATFQAVESWRPVAHAPMTPVWFPDGAGEWEWQDAGVVNGGFETGDLTGWTVQQGSPDVTAGGNYVAEGTYACRGSSSSGDTVNIDQAITIPANAVAYHLSGWDITGFTDGDTGWVYVEFFDAGSQLIGGTVLGPPDTDAQRKDFVQAIAPVPDGAVTCRLGAWMVAETGTNNGGVDGIGLSFLVGTALPSATSAGLVNGDFESGDLTGWNEEQGSWEVTANGALGSYGARPDDVSFGVLVQGANIPAGSTHAVLRSWIGSQIDDRDYAAIELRFRDSLGGVIGTSTRLYGARNAAIQNWANQIAEIPQGSHSVDVVLIGTRLNGTAVNSVHDSIDVDFLQMPLAFSLALASV
ncbi:MAG: hypothetical protein CME59_02115 [Halioglobus sp.]|nr:hypothetical protein [Halioglobus sp.]